MIDLYCFRDRGGNSTCFVVVFATLPSLFGIGTDIENEEVHCEGCPLCWSGADRQEGFIF